MTRRPPPGAGRRPPRAAAGGYVLLLVIGFIAVASVVAALFAERIAGLQQQMLARQQGVADERTMRSGMAATLYWLATRRPRWEGYAESTLSDPALVLRLDGSPYQLPNGAIVQVQDERGLLSLNTFDRNLLARLLASQGVETEAIDGLLDTLLDYTDTDGLKRLNGAETAEYRALGLPAPRNDWLASVSELAALPLWRDRPQLMAPLQQMASPRRSGLLNPNAMDQRLLRALQPAATPEQLQQFETLRLRGGFRSAEQAAEQTGLAFVGDHFLFYSSADLRVRVGVPNKPQVLQYNATLTPAGRYWPWQITAVQRGIFVPPNHVPQARLQPFPLDRSMAPQTGAAPAAAP